MADAMTDASHRPARKRVRVTLIARPCPHTVPSQKWNATAALKVLKSKSLPAPSTLSPRHVSRSDHGSANW